MFTGLISNLGVVRDSVVVNEFVRVGVACASWRNLDLELGESIAVNGCCLTVVDRDHDGFVVDLSPETVRLTTLGSLRSGAVVNLERAMMVSARWGGHFVTGHVDGVGAMTSVSSIGDGLDLRVAVTETLLKYIAVKGSIAVDGVSLTVNSIESTGFGVMIIPHTRERTVVGEYTLGTRVNIEVDLMARYVERMLSFAKSGERGGGLTREWLADQGYS